MRINYIAFAVPLFLFLIGLEYWYSLKKNKQVYHFKESIANLNVGISERMCDLLTSGAFYFAFVWLYDNYAIFHIQSNLFTWIILILATDLIWYWYHRFGHKVSIFWSAHVVHHQSADFNYSVSARITVLQAFARGLFWSILPVIGFPPGMIATMLLIHGAYPFFTHTQLVGKLGWLEYFLVTPSHHRVHHSSNPEYIDKNFGDILIVWDKLFGTFVEEKETPKYGLNKPLDSHSFLWQHFHFPLEMLVAFKRAKGVKNKMKIVFGKPDEISPNIRVSLERYFLRRNHHTALSTLLARLITLQTTFTLAVLFVSILFSYYLNAYQLFILFLFIILSVITTGALLDQKRWIFPLEFARLSLVGIFLCISFPNNYVYITTMHIVLIACFFYESLRKLYFSAYTYRDKIKISQTG